MVNIFYFFDFSRFMEILMSIFLPFMHLIPCIFLNISFNMPPQAKVEMNMDF